MGLRFRVLGFRVLGFRVSGQGVGVWGCGLGVCNFVGFGIRPAGRFGVFGDPGSRGP